MTYISPIRVPLFILLLLALVAGCPAATWIYAGDGSVPDIGDETIIPVVLSVAPDTCIWSFNINITMANPAIAEVTAVQFPDWVDQTDVEPSLPGTSLYIRGDNLARTNLTSTDYVVLADLVVKGKAVGESWILLDQPTVEWEGGVLDHDDIGPISGSIEVGGPVEPLIADFTGDGTTGPAPLLVQFHDTSTGTPDWWRWDFGDGNTTEGETDPYWDYTEPGTYNVTLTACRGSIENTTVKTGFVVVTGIELPHANFTVTPATGYAPLTVTFTDQSEGTGITTWDWTFGDGNTSTFTNGNPVFHTYTSQGTYGVSLTVTNASGSDTCLKTEYIRVGTPIAINWITPASGINGTSVKVTINGTNFGGPAATKVNLTQGGTTIPATGITVTGTTKISCTFPIPTNAMPGLWDLIVVNTTSGMSGTKTNAFMVYRGQNPTISSVTPTSGLRNTTIPFSISGTNFQSTAVVNFTNSTFGNLTWTPGTITKTKITGSVLFPPGASTGKWDVVVTVPDGRNVTRKSAFEVKAWKPPKVSSITPTSGYRNATISFSLSGSDFEAGSVVNFTNGTYGNITASLGTVTLTKITGTVLFPPGAPTGKWDITIVTPDGGRGPTKSGAFTVNPWKQPAVSSLAPTSGLVNTTVSFTLSGTGFQPGAVVNFTNNTPPGGNLTTAITVVSPTKIAGNLTIPYNSPAGKWSIIITTPDGGQGVPKAGAFTVKDWTKPTISSMNQTKGVHGTTIRYRITGTNFQPGSSVTFTNSSAAGLNFTAGVDTVIITRISGSVTIPASSIGKYGIEVLCPDGKSASKKFAFTVT